MSCHLDVRLTSPFQIGDVVALLIFADGNVQRWVLRAGSLQCNLPVLPIRLQLTCEPAPAGQPPLQRSEISLSHQLVEGAVVEAEELFERGVRIPESGTLALQLIWGVHCHHTETGPSLVEKFNGEAESEVARFLSAEHVKCAQRVGLDATWEKPLIANGITANFNAQTPLPIGARHATFGQLIALAGDFYAYLDEAAKNANGNAWPEAPGWIEFVSGDYREPTLVEDDTAITGDILAAFERELAALQRGEKVGSITDLLSDSVTTSFPMRRFLALASLNYCHFGAQQSDGTVNDDVNEALQSYRYYHRRAMAQAEVAGISLVNKQEKFIYSLVIEAFGCHFLTDLFASGHIRVPRRALGNRFGVFRGALGMAHGMHDEDNNRGLWCTTRLAQVPRVTWRAYGDSRLFHPEAAVHLAMVQEAVRRSAAEVFLRYCGIHDVAETDTAEALLPVPLPAASAPLASDVLPLGMGRRYAPEQPANHFPLYVVMEGGTREEPRIAGRINKQDPQANLYAELDVDDAQPFPLRVERTP